MNSPFFICLSIRNKIEVTSLNINESSPKDEIKSHDIKKESTSENKESLKVDKSPNTSSKKTPVPHFKSKLDSLLNEMESHIKMISCLIPDYTRKDSKASNRVEGNEEMMKIINETLREANK